MRMIEEPGPIELLAASYSGSMDGIQLKLALSELYETTYGIYDHENGSPTRPLALVACHVQEDSSSFSPLHRRVHEYMELKLFESTGIPLDRLMEMPADLVRVIIDKAKAGITRTGAHVDKQLRQLESEMGKGPKPG